MAVPEWKIEQELELIKQSNVTPQEAYILGSMKHKSLEDLKKNLEAFNNLKTLAAKFSLSPQPKLALFQALVDEDTHTMITILSRCIPSISPPESLLLSFNPSIQPSSTLPQNSVNPSPSLYPPINQSYPIPNQSPSSSLRLPSNPPISSTFNQAPTPTPDLTPSQNLPPVLTRHLPYNIPKPSIPSPAQPSANGLPGPLFRSTTSVDVAVLECKYCGEANPIQDCLIRCKCGYKYCHNCLEEDYVCKCHLSLSRKIQPKCN